MPLLEGAKRLNAGAGIQFDAEIVTAMLNVVERIESVQAFDEAQTACGDAQHDPSQSEAAL